MAFQCSVADLVYQLGPMISPSIYNPVVDEVKADLNGTETQIGLSLSIYILLQGCVPVVWASTAEIIGRKVSPLEVELSHRARD